MKLATLKSAKPDGELVVVSRDLARMARVPEIAPHLQAALDDWAKAKPRLEERSNRSRNARKGPKNGLIGLLHPCANRCGKRR